MSLPTLSFSLLSILLTIRPLAADTPATPAPGWLDIEPVWSGHPVGFSLLTHPPHQFAAYYDAGRRMTVARRHLDETNWTFTRLPSTLGWDSHNDVTMAVDRDGHLHVSGNMHCVPLVYFRTTRPGDPASLEAAAMTGERESRVTYPVFLRDRAGRLVFRYRDGGSGNGDDLYNVYDERTRSWRRLVDGPLLSGEGQRNAYATVPRQGPDGRFHIVWVWRDTPDCATNHNLSYARSDDLAHWTDSAGRPLALPITLATGEIIDPVPPRGGLLNVNRKLGFDNTGRPVVTYHKYDAAGDLQVYAARREAAGWEIRQLSNWTGYRWDFSGGGTILVEVVVGAVRPLGDGRLALPYRYPNGSGTWVLDEQTLTPVPGAVAPAELRLPAAAWPAPPDFAGMQPRRAADTGQPVEGEANFLLWHSLPANRDRPRPGPPPPPAMLRLVGVMR